MPYLLLSAYLAIACAIQLLAGDFPVTFFAFPLNVIMAALWLGCISWLWKFRRESVFVRFMLSRGASISAVAVFLVFCLTIGVTGIRSIVNTWIFVAFMLYFQTVLLFVIIRGWRSGIAAGTCGGRVRWRFVLNHTGLLIAVSSAFWGAPDSYTSRLPALRNVPTREAFRMDGTRVWLPFEMELTDFTVDTFENGTPSMYEAEMLIDDVTVTLKVNHPYSKGIDTDISLSGYDSGSGHDPEYCIIQIVKEPWKYMTVAGIVLMIAGAFLMFVSGPCRPKTDE